LTPRFSAHCISVRYLVGWISAVGLLTGLCLANQGNVALSTQQVLLERPLRLRAPSSQLKLNTHLHIMTRTYLQSPNDSQRAQRQQYR